MALSLNQSGVIDLGAIVLTGYPFTMAGWFRVPNVSSLLTLMRIDNTATTSYHALIYEGHSAGQCAVVSKVTVTGAARTAIAMTPGDWHHVVGVFESHDSRRVYLDGGNMGSGANSRIFDGANQFRAGNISTSNMVDAAEIAIFSAVLTEGEISMLARGCPVLSLPKANSLLACHNLVRGINRPGIGPFATLTGSVGVVEHPRVFLAGGGRTLAQPCRACGPFQIDQESLRTSSSEQAQVSVAGIADGAGQMSAAGVVADSSILYAEVV